MAITCQENETVFVDVVSVEDAEPLLAWLHDHPRTSVNLAACTHLHAAALQVLMAARPPISAWPVNDALAAWLTTALSESAPSPD